MKKNIEEIKNNTTILIAGPINMKSISNIENYAKFCKNIVISAWSDYPKQYSIDDVKTFLYQQNLSSEAFEKVRITLSECPLMHYKIKNPEFHHYKTLLPQVVGILNGANLACGKEIKNEYLIRTRSDEFFTDLDPIIKIYSNDINNVVFGNVVWRIDNKNYRGLHVGDHIFMSKSSLIQKVYDTFYNLAYTPRMTKNFINCEVTLAHIFNTFLDRELWDNDFFTVSIESLGDYEVSVAGKIFNNQTTLKDLKNKFVLKEGNVYKL